MVTRTTGCRSARACGCGGPAVARHAGRRFVPAPVPVLPRREPLGARAEPREGLVLNGTGVPRPACARPGVAAPRPPRLTLAVIESSVALAGGPFRAENGPGRLPMS